MRKFQRYFYNLLNTVNDLSVTRNLVKTTIGDSRLNNRVLTVSQVIRYLKANGSYAKAKKLQSVYDTLRPYVLLDRQDATNRTDAIDINELVATYRAIVMDDGQLRSVIGRIVG